MFSIRENTVPRPPFNIATPTSFINPGDKDYDVGFVDLVTNRFIRGMVTGGGPNDIGSGTWSTDAIAVLNYFTWCVQNPTRKAPVFYLRGEEGDERSILVAILQKLLGREDVRLTTTTTTTDASLGSGTNVATCTRKFADEDRARGLAGECFARLETELGTNGIVFPGSDRSWASLAGFFRTRTI